MTLRQSLGGETSRLHEMLEEMLDQEDVVILLFDGERAVNYSSGFGLSPSQHEFMAVTLEQVVRSAGASKQRRRTRRRKDMRDIDNAA